MKYVSADIETTGIDPEWCQIIEIGAVIDDLNNQKAIKDLATFHCYVVHDRFQGQPYALSMHPKIFRRIDKQEVGYYYFRPTEIASVFDTWLRSHYPGYPNENYVNFAGKNFAAFDLQFLKKLDGWEDDIKYRHRVLDPGMMFLRKEDGNLPDSKECLERAGIGGDVSHTALQDAIDVVKELRVGWNKLN